MPSALSNPPSEPWSAASRSRASAAAAPDPAATSAWAAKAVASASLEQVSSPIVAAEPAVGALLGEEDVDRGGGHALAGADEGHDREGLADGVRVVARGEAAVHRQVGEPSRLHGPLGGPQLVDEVEAAERGRVAPVGDHGEERLGRRAGVGRGEVGTDVAADVVLEVGERGIGLVRPGPGPVERQDRVDGVAAVEVRRRGVDVVVVTGGERARDEVRGVHGLRGGGGRGVREPCRRRGGDGLVARHAGRGRGDAAPRRGGARRGHRSAGTRGGLGRRAGRGAGLGRTRSARSGVGDGSAVLRAACGGRGSAVGSANASTAGPATSAVATRRMPATRSGAYRAVVGDIGASLSGS